MSTHFLRRVYVWELPVRLFHWINVLAIVVLCITGYMIGRPPAILLGGEAYERYWFGWIRYIHFVAAYIFFFNYIFRIYWGFVGNKYARWKNFIPVTKKYWKDMWEVFRFDIFQIKREDHMEIGHNALAGFSYFMIFIAFLVQCFTGFGLYARMSHYWVAKMFGWVPAVTGGDFFLRQWHHVFLWVFILFTIVHIYLVFFHDFVEGRGEMSSIGGGWKFIEEEAFQKEEAREKETAENVNAG